MITSVSDWLAFLKSADTLIGIPLLVGGLALMLTGWRVWKFCVVVSFGLIGVGIGSALSWADEYRWICALVGGVVLGGLSYRPARHAVAVLGGVIGAGFILYLLSGINLPAVAVWLVGGATFFGCSALAFISRQTVMIGVTAFLGAVLLISGLTVFVMTSPVLYGYFEATAAGGTFVAAFLLLVPTVVSSFYQSSEVHRLGADI